MTPGEKYSKVLITSRKKAYKAEDLCGFGRNTISNAIKDNRELSEEYHKIFMSKMGVNPIWWESGKGDILLKNHTPVQKGTDNKENILGVELGDAIRRIVEDNTEYLIIPKVVLDGKYRLVPIEQIQKDAKELEDRTAQIMGLHDLIKQITHDITARPINIQLTSTEKT